MTYNQQIYYWHKVHPNCYSYPTTASLQDITIPKI